MGMREELQKRPGIVAAVAIVGVLFAGFMFFRGSGSEAPSSNPGQAYYSVDDGATFFADQADKLTPFDKDGKPAVNAGVFSCDGGKTKFVGYLTRLKPEVKARVDELIAREKNGNAGIAQMISGNMEMKTPGVAGKWEPMRDPGAARRMKITPPAGQKGEPAQVSP